MYRHWINGSREQSGAGERRFGFTLIEIMVALALFAVLATTAGPSLRRSSVSTKGAAMALAAALSEVRQQAITQQVPVALVIPSDNGSQGQADSYFIAAGEQPRVIRVKRIGGEQSGLRLMVGHWPLDTGKLQDSTSTTTITPPAEATWENDFDLNLWGLPAAQDYAFVFTPRGKLITNDLPHFDGAYRIVVSHGGRSSASPAPGSGVMTMQPTIHSLTQVGSPYTVSISPAGSVSVTPGLLASTSAVEVRKQAAITMPPAPPNLSPPPVSAPVVTSVTMLPDPAKLELPAGVDMFLAPGRHVSITVRANSPEWAPLSFRWTASDGGLSSPKAVRATYLPQTQEWESVWQWRFPTDAKMGDQFTLQGVVKDDYGNEAPVGLGAGADPFVVEAGEQMSIAFLSDRDGNEEIYMVQGDGTGLTRLTDDPSRDLNPSMSPDKTKLLWNTNRDGNFEVYVMNADGTGATNLSNDPAYDGDARWAPDGGTVVFESERTAAGFFELWRINADGTGLTQLTHDGDNSNETQHVTSPDGTMIAYQRVIGGDSKVWLMSSDGTGAFQAPFISGGYGYHLFGNGWSPNSQTLAFYGYNSAWQRGLYLVQRDGSGLMSLSQDGFGTEWSPDGQFLYFTSDQTGDFEIFRMRADGSDVVNLTNHPDNDAQAGLSWDGQKIAFLSSRVGSDELYIMDVDGTNVKNLSDSGAGETMHAWSHK